MVELFMADWLPRKVAFAASTVAQVPYVLRAWIRFAGERRGTRPVWPAADRRRWSAADPRSAAGALHAAGALAGLFRPDTTPYVRADELAAAAVVAKGTTTAKAALIRDTFGLRTGDAAVTHPSIDDLSCWWRGR